MPTSSIRHSDRQFFMFMGATAFAVVLSGFGPTYFLRFLSGAPPLGLLVHVHAALFSAWLALILCQALLIRAGNFGLHRQFGMFGVCIAVLMVITGYMVVLGKPRPDAATRAFIFTPMVSLMLFPLFVAAAVYFRRQGAMHKRLTLLATIVVSTAGVARLMAIAGISPAHYRDYALTYALLLVPLVCYDLVKLKRLHPATLWGGLLMLLRHPLHEAIAYTAGWQRIAERLTPG